MSINIRNESGQFQSFAVIPEPAKVSGGPQPQVWSVVVSSLQVPPGGQGSVQIQGVQAVAGQSRSALNPGTQISVSSQMGVNLGSSSFALSNGQLQPGGQPPREKSFSVTVEGPGSDRGSVIGYSVNANGRGQPASIFSPQPNSTYNIEPTQTWYLAMGRNETGTVVDVRQLGNAARFNLSGGRVNFVATPDGRIIQQQ